MFPRTLSLLLLANGALFASGCITPQGSFTYSPTELRGGAPFRRMVEDAEKAFFQVTSYLPGDAPPIQLMIREKGLPASLTVNALEGGDPEIRLVVPKDPTDHQLPQFLSAALILRQYYGKKAPVPGSVVPQYPPWLTRGLGTLILQRTSEDFSRQSNPELESFLTERVPEPEHASLLKHYDAVASVLVRSGLSDERCKRAFRDWIGSYDPEKPSLKSAAWVEGWDMRSVERRWSLGLQAPEKDEQLPGMIQTTSCTLRQFRRIMEESRAGKESLAEVAKERGGEFRLQGLVEKLTALRLQANPLTTTLVERSMKLVMKAKRLPPKKVSREEEMIGQDCDTLEKKAREIEDYLDWCEATKVNIPSGFFDGYLYAPDSVPGKGPVGRHLDAVESRGW